MDMDIDVDVNIRLIIVVYIIGVCRMGNLNAIWNVFEYSN
jgi:hypothetical protein